MAIIIPKFPVRRDMTPQDIVQACTNILEAGTYTDQLTEEQVKTLESGGLRARKDVLVSVYYLRLEAARQAAIESGYVECLPAHVTAPLELNPVGDTPLKHDERKQLLDALWAVKKLSDDVEREDRRSNPSGNRGRRKGPKLGKPQRGRRTAAA